ncbi:MAG: MFS transporter [Bifidobacterium sp.]|nr:MFS transporter [Bifidobacterium sp.]
MTAAADATDRTPAREEQKERLITRDVALLMVAALFYMTGNALANPIIAGFSGSLGASGVMMGLIAALMTVTSLFCRPIAGNLADRAKKRVIAIAGAALYLAADVWYAFAPSMASLVGARIVNGVGFACCSVCLASWLSTLLPISRMGAGMGLYGTVNALSNAVGPDIGIRCSETIGYRATFLIGAAMSVCVVVALLCVKDPGRPLRKPTANEPLREAVEDATEEFLDGETGQIRSRAAKPAPRGRSLLGKLVEPKVVPIAVVFMMFVIPFCANQSFIVEYASERHLGGVQVSLFFPVYAAALLIMRVALRNWFDTKSFRFFLVGATVCDLGMLACLTFMRSDWALVAAAVLTAGAYGMMSSVTQSRAITIAGKARSGMANTTYYAGIDLGQAIGQLAGGVLFGALPIAWFYPVLMLTMPVGWPVYLLWGRGADARRARRRARVAACHNRRRFAVGRAGQAPSEPMKHGW